MFGGAIAAAVLPLGSLALPKQKRPQFSAVEMDLRDFEKRILDPAVQRLSEQIDAEMMKIFIEGKPHYIPIWS
jgi:hypothetical protein